MFGVSFSSCCCCTCLSFLPACLPACLRFLLVSVEATQPTFPQVCHHVGSVDNGTRRHRHRHSCRSSTCPHLDKTCTRLPPPSSCSTRGRDQAGRERREKCHRQKIKCFTKCKTRPESKKSCEIRQGILTTLFQLDARRGWRSQLAPLRPMHVCKKPINDPLRTPNPCRQLAPP